MERIALGREYRVAEWLRNAYLELTQKTPSEFEELWPAKPYSNSLNGNWEAASMEWETLARIFFLQTKMAASMMSSAGSNGTRYYCSQCCRYFGVGNVLACKCRFLPMVDEAFHGEFESLKENPEHVEHPLPCKFTISYLCPLKIDLYSQQHEQPERRTWRSWWRMWSSYIPSSNEEEK